jgi:hypothetical protein
MSYFLKESCNMQRIAYLVSTSTTKGVRYCGLKVDYVQEQKASYKFAC